MLLQCVAYTFQEKVHIGMSLSKMYTDIMLKNRQTLMDTMNDYILFIEKIKYKNILEETEKNQLMEYYYKINAYKNIICEMKPGNVCIDYKEVTEFYNFLPSITADLKKGKMSIDAKNDAINNLQQKYRNFLSIYSDQIIQVADDEIFKRNYNVFKIILNMLAPKKNPQPQN